MSSYSRSFSRTSSSTEPISSKTRRKSSGDLTMTPLSSQPKSRRLRLSLKKDWSGTSTESNSYTVSSETARSSNVVQQSYRENTDHSNYVVLAKKFGINVTVAKKYHNILTKAPKIPIVKITNVKEEIVSPCTSPITVQNPVYKIKKLKIKYGSGSTKIKTGPDNIKIKKEPGEPETVVNMSRSVSKKIANYFDTLNGHLPIKKEILSPEPSPNNKFSFTKEDSLSPLKNPLSKWKNIIDSDGEDEFATPVPKRFTKFFDSPVTKSDSQNKSLRPNPFAIMKNKKKKGSSQIETESKQSKNSTKNKKKYGVVDTETIQKSFTESFKIQKENDFHGFDDNDDFVVQSRIIKEHAYSVQQDGTKLKFTLDPNSKLKKNILKLKTSDSSNISTDFMANMTENKNQKESKDNKMKKIKLCTTKSQNSYDNILESIDSMSVNCQIFSSQNKKMENESFEDEMVESQLISFGASSDEDELEKDATKEKQKSNSLFNSDFDNFDLNKSAKNQNNVSQINYKPESSCNDIKQSPSKKKSNEKSESQKAKPIIKSDEFSKNRIKLLPKIKKKIFPVANSPVINNSENQSETNSTMNMPNNHIENNNVVNNSLSTNSTMPVARTISPIIGGTKRSSLHIQHNLNKNLNRTAKEMKTSGESNNINAEESFDFLCNDITRMSNENITLYKDDTQLPNVNGTGEKIVLKLSGNMLNDKVMEIPTIKSTVVPQSSQNSQEPTTAQLSQSYPVNTPSISSRDPRINRSISPIKTPSNVSRDPRLNRSISPIKPAAAATITSGSLSQEADSDMPADPRLRKRKSNEEIEQSAKMSKTIESEEENKKTAPSITSTPIQSSSVFDRLDSKVDSLSSNGHIMQNEFTNVIKNRPQRRKSICDERDDDELSLFAEDLNLSEDEMESPSPPHRKFVSERISIDDEMAYTPYEPKSRFGGNRDANRASKFGTGMGAGSGAPSTGISSRLGKRNSTGNWQNPQPTQTATARSKIPAGRTAGSINVDATFNNFRLMNEQQMLRDEDNFRTQQLENNEYVTFGENGLANGNSTRFDNVSMFNGNTKAVGPHVITSNHTTFFKNYCYKLLRTGKCHLEANCQFSHAINFLYKLVKQTNPIILLHIISVAIENEYNFFLDSIWVIALPILHDRCFTVFEKYYKKNRRTERIIIEMLNFCIKFKLCTADSFAKRVAPIIENNDNESVRIICTALKGKLTEGFCWEAIKDLCQKAVPPRDMIELAILQCLNRKKNPSHIKEVFHLVNVRMSEVERNKLSSNMLSKFYNLVESQKIVPSKEVLNTIPLMSNTNASNLLQNKQLLDGIENQKPAGMRLKKTNSFGHDQPDSSPLQVGKNTPVSGESVSSTYDLQQVDASQPGSVWHKRFWKLYNSVHCVQQGLSYADYAYVWRTLDEYSRNEQFENELLKRACYHILCDNVITCERHVAGVLKQAGNPDHNIIKYIKSVKNDLNNTTH